MKINITKGEQSITKFGANNDNSRKVEQRAQFGGYRATFSKKSSYDGLPSVEVWKNKAKTNI